MDDCGLLFLFLGLMIKLIECPRDAMQGIDEFIPTGKKAAYINQLLKVGFDTIDFGSFVSPKAIPQLRDTAQVLEQLDLDNTSSKLLAIIANQRGAEDAVRFDQITYLGYPFSISETFQQRNTNASIAESMGRVEDIQALCQSHQKQLVIYISMGFGNPYGDPWNVEEVEKWVSQLAALDINIFALADTVGVARPDSIRYLFSHLIPAYPELEIGAHFHSALHNWEEKVAAAYENGCKRYDSAIKGFGGCPMAEDELVGNLATENLVAYFTEKSADLNIDQEAFQVSMEQAAVTFPI